MCAQMNTTSPASSENCNVLQSRTFDDNRFDSTELGRNLQITAATCTIMAEKIMKKSSTKKSRKSDPCEQSTEKLVPRILELEEELSALKTECDLLRKLPENCKATQNQKPILQAHSESEQADKICVLRAENMKLRQLLKDVTEVNKRWQKYNHERQDHLQRLLEAIHEQHKQPISHLLLNSEIPIKERRHHKIIAGCRHSDSQLEHVGELSALQQRYENAVKEICQLKKQLEESRQIQEAIIQQLELTRNENKDQMFMLEMQSKAFKEDWEAEKQDKLVALEKIEKLNKELEESKLELNNLKKVVKQIGETSGQSNSLERNFSRRMKPSAPFANSGITNNFAFNIKERGVRYSGNISNYDVVPDISNESIRGAPSPRKPVIADEVKKCSITDDHKNELECTGCKKLSLKSLHLNESKRSLSAPSSWGPAIADEVKPFSIADDLECPGCKKFFPYTRHLEFLDHFEECQATSS